MTEFQIQPWYSLVESRELLRRCVATPPRVITSTQRFGRKVDEYRSYDDDDARVARLKAIYVHHTAQYLNDREHWQRAKEAGTLISVDMAIDAVMPQPLVGPAGYPGYLQLLPVIDLEMGRAVAA